MSIESISVNTTVTEPSPVRVNTSFNYDVPDTLEQALNKFAPEEVYKLFKSALVIALQAPARKLMAEAWEGFSEELRAQYTVLPEKEGGVVVGTLPPEAQNEIQEFFTSWSPEVKLARRTGVRPVDAVKVLMDSWDSLTPERQAEIQAAMEARFGSTSGKSRR